MEDRARSCIATITSARRGDIDISLAAFDASGSALATVQGK